MTRRRRALPTMQGSAWRMEAFFALLEPQLTWSPPLVLQSPFNIAPRCRLSAPLSQLFVKSKQLLDANGTTTPIMALIAHQTVTQGLCPRTVCLVLFLDPNPAVFTVTGSTQQQWSVRFSFPFCWKAGRSGSFKKRGFLENVSYWWSSRLWWC